MSLQTNPTSFLAAATGVGIPVLWITDDCRDVRPAIAAAGGAVHCLPALAPVFGREQMLRADGSPDPHMAALCATALASMPGRQAWSIERLEAYLDLEAESPAGAERARLLFPELEPHLDAAALTPAIWTPLVAGICLCRVPARYRVATVLRLVGTAWLEFRGMDAPQFLVLENVWRFLHRPEERGHLRYLSPPWLMPPVELFLVETPRHARLDSSAATPIGAWAPTPTPPSA